MSSIVRATPAQMTRRVIVLAAAIFAIVVGQGQMALGLGQTAAEFAADSDATLKVAGYAFAIWGLIYLGLLVYAVRQVLPQTGESLLIQRFGWPSAAAMTGIGLWIVAAAMDAELATVVLIFGSLAVLLVPLLGNAGAIRALPIRERDRWMLVWPLALLAGWLTVAAPLNLITVATGNGALPAALPPTVWAMIAIAVVGVVALGVTQRIRTVAYAIPIAWGLLGAFVAEQPRNGALAYFALAAAVGVLVGAIVLSLGLRRGVERPVRA
ncbi:hypothetical protein [Brevundimonas sp. Root1423]|uniref:hypothetical protein n=1 Tax=Brevundimonas sp. Root1423 TaxID=1736462 RepID=UPI0006F7A8FF|nr:hypothetical protein [Brevundimonas sp. Root1423]KQY84665.1 hypothetical protein ASD25_06415 [Brevundimonas sp. Root1423]